MTFKSVLKIKYSKAFHLIKCQNVQDDENFIAIIKAILNYS